MPPQSLRYENNNDKNNEEAAKTGSAVPHLEVSEAGGQWDHSTLPSGVKFTCGGYTTSHAANGGTYVHPTAAEIQ